MQQTLTGWGLYPSGNATVTRPEKRAALTPPTQPQIARGLGRSYGDAAMLTDGHVVLMQRLNRFLEFDEAQGLLRVEAGVSLREILEVMIPRGWFLKVTPGTTFATVGGCIAADVHGKNHHRDGSFCMHVLELELMLADGSRLRCSPYLNPDFFWATAGGMGLTGVITEAVLQLQRIETTKLVVNHIAAANIAEAMDILSDPKQDAPYSVAWIDCLASGNKLGRSIVMNGRHATVDDLPVKERQNPLSVVPRKERSLPFHLPGFALNSWTVKAFNALYYKYQASSQQPFLTGYQEYFYPLDAIHHWNRLYGKKGFIQYQFVVPAATAKAALPLLLQELVKSQKSSFLAVLKRFGKQNPGFLSFPQEGFTLAVDIPVKQSLFPFLNQLDEWLLTFKGRVYLAKDARLNPQSFQAMYPRWKEWQAIKQQLDPHNLYVSDLSKRLFGEGK